MNTYSTRGAVIALATAKQGGVNDARFIPDDTSFDAGQEVGQARGRTGWWVNPNIIIEKAS